MSDDNISRQEAVEALCTMECGDDSEYCVKRTCEIFTTLMRLPAAPVREVVLCKDCMHNGSYDTDCPIDWNGKEYCSFGERNDE